MIEHNAFCNSEPQEDQFCCSSDNYDLTDWNDCAVPDWEDGDTDATTRCGCSNCGCGKCNPDTYDNSASVTCCDCRETSPCDCACEQSVCDTSEESQDTSEEQTPYVYRYGNGQQDYESEIIQI